VEVAGSDLGPGIGDADEGFGQVLIAEADGFEHGAGAGAFGAVDEGSAALVEGGADSVGRGHGVLLLRVAGDWAYCSVCAGEWQILADWRRLRNATWGLRKGTIAGLARVCGVIGGAFAFARASVFSANEAGRYGVVKRWSVGRVA